jgi:outer membrane protein assembly factor BamD
LGGEDSFLNFNPINIHCFLSINLVKSLSEEDLIKSVTCSLERSIILLCYACAGFMLDCGSNTVSTKDIGSVEAARKSYIEAMDEMKSGNYTEALDIFQQISRGQRYIKYTSLSKLRTADTLLLQDRHLEAIDFYRSFIDTNEADKNLHYAYFKMAEAYFKKIPMQFFLLAPLEEKDITSVVEAYRALDEFLLKFPNSPFSPMAADMHEQCFQTILKHQMNIIDFYISREKPKAAVNRIESLFIEYPQSKHVEKLHLVLGQGYLDTGKPAAAINICNEYSSIFPFGKLKEDFSALKYRAVKNLKQ